MNTVRLIVPWDAGLRAGPWDAWIARAQRDGAAIMVALEHDAASRCPDSPCVLPPAEAYGDALAALLARYPSIREVTPWNEPNHGSQPTFRLPEAAARFYDEARERCPACTLVAGTSSMTSRCRATSRRTRPRWLDAGRLGPAQLLRLDVLQSARRADDAGRHERPALAHGDRRHRLVRAPGGGGLPYDEARAADGVAWLYELADRHPEIERMYLYQWQASPDNGFDAGLLGADGAPRPAYAVVAGGSGRARVRRPLARPAARQPGAAPRGCARPGRRLRLLAGGRLVVRVRCVVRGAGVERCRRRLVVRVAGTVVARLAVDVAAGSAFQRTVRLAPRLRRHLMLARRPRVQLQTCTPAGRRCLSRSDVAVSRAKALRR